MVRRFRWRFSPSTALGAPNPAHDEIRTHPRLEHSHIRTWMRVACRRVQSPSDGSDRRPRGNPPGRRISVRVAADDLAEVPGAECPPDLDPDRILDEPNRAIG